jgi:periplasmic glucans biosynthesis protein
MMVPSVFLRRGSRSLSCVVIALILLGRAPAFANNFDLKDVIGTARKLAAEPFKPPPAIPDFLKQISYDDYRDIRFDTSQSVWKDSGNFQVQFIHPGLFYTHNVTINTVDAKGVHKVPFSPRQFSYGRNKFADKIPADLGFAGFRIAYPLYKKDEYNHVIVFAGASYFRAVARKQVFGLSARGLAIDTALPSGEEFPTFREFWIERPAPKASSIKILALLDSQNITGAYEFIVRPGDRTTVDVRASLFERKRVKELGIAPLTSMFLFGEEKPRPRSDWRPEVHDSDGLLMASATGEWIWRPLINPAKLQVSYFEFDNLRGFGLLQRDRDFSNYEDLETRHELRPNAWITPQGNWSRGHVKLVEIPSPKETNDNIVAYWVPRDLPPVGQALELAYRMSFQNEDPLDPPVGRVAATRIGTGDKDDLRRIVVDFEGAKLKALPDTAPVKAVISVGQEAQLIQQSVVKNPLTGGWRVAFQLKAPKDKPLHVRGFLQHENDTLTETWSYLLEP